MHSHLPEHAVVTLLRQCFLTPRCKAVRSSWPSSCQNPTRSLHSSTCCRRRPASIQTLEQGHYQNLAGYTDNASLAATQTISIGPSADEQLPLESQSSGQLRQERSSQKIAVLGGGITGLASAYYLTRELPKAQITVYEGSSRLGGWLRSQQFNVGNGNVILEQGPRTLRPSSAAGSVTLEMIKNLGLEDQLLITPKTSAAAQNRFIYYPDHLVRMPGPGQDLYSIAWSMFTEPVFKGLPLGAIYEYSRPTRPLDLEDESVGSFLDRRFGNPGPANNIVSAILHGIYAGDIYQLSIRSLVPTAWHGEAVEGSLTQGMITSFKQKTFYMPFKDAVLQQEMYKMIDGPLLSSMVGASVYTFKTGMEALSLALEKSMRANPNVQFKLGHKIDRVEYEAEHEGIKIKTTQNHPPAKYTCAISTISGRTLSTLTTIPKTLPSLAATHAVTVMVVNLYYADPNILPERGFGYLIPRSISYEQNPECALGVVFDSDATMGQDSVPGTKVTVMLGGHWWDGFESYPDEEEGASMAKAVLRRHLAIEQEPVLVNVGLQRECIPQYTVGHDARMRKAHRELMTAFKGKLAVAGSSYTGVGVNDCIRAARDVVMGMKEGADRTGLEGFVEPLAWVQTKV